MNIVGKMFTKLSLLSKLCILFACTCHIALAYSPWNFNGTTPNLQTIIKGRCYSYKLLKPESKDVSFQVRASCDDVWNEFVKGFKGKDECRTDLSKAYDNLLNLVDTGALIEDRAMLWSGTKEVAHDFTAVNTYYRTLEDTFLGYIADNLKFCGCENCAGGLNKTLCYWVCESTKTNGAAKNFWESISRQFASKASGIVSVMVNGTQNGTYTAYSKKFTIFGKIELPELIRRGRVKRLDVYVVNTLDKNPKESCKNGTVLDLINDATNGGIPSVRCVDDPDMVQYVLCSKYYGAIECNSTQERIYEVRTKIRRVDSDSDDDDEGWMDATITLIVLFVVMIAIFVYDRFFNTRRKSSSTSKSTIEA